MTVSPLPIAEPHAESADRTSAPIKISTLADARRFFVSRATPRLILPALLVAVALRVRHGDWGLHDLLMAAGILAFEPFTEWLIHVFVLHSTPRRLGPIRLDLHAARKHREHHGNPNDPMTSFVPLVDLVVLGLVVLVLERLLARTTGAFLTGIVVSLAMLLTYEWTHFLIHTAYKPKGRYYRHLWRSHRLHHFKNEHYWYGVTVTLGDRILRTAPDKSSVPNSDTARTLGVDPEPLGALTRS